MNGRRSRMVRRSMALALTAKPAAVGILALTPQVASAANVTVACAAGGPGLKAAIASANASGGTVTLASGCTYSIANPTTAGEALPLITGTVVVNGNGATITRTGATPLRMFHVKRGGNLTLDHVTVSNGLTLNNVGGAGIFNELGTLTVTRSTISGNKATASLTGKGSNDASGGGILSNGSTTISNSVVTGNEARSAASRNGQTTIGEPFASGGGIAAKGGTLRVVNTTISKNVAAASSTGGGLAAANGGGIAAAADPRVATAVTVRVSGSTLTDNAATGTATNGSSSLALGGALDQFATGPSTNTMSVVNSTLTGNKATASQATGLTGDGGAILTSGGTGQSLSVVNSTIAKNVTSGSTSSAGAVEMVGTTGTATLTNTIIASNVGANCRGTIADAGGNISFPATDTSCTATFSHGNPQLGPLQDNGGPTQTMALGTGSAAIDTAFAIACGQASPAGAGGVDQRGLPRMEVLADPKCDVGAFEVQPVAVVVQPSASPTPGLPKAGTQGSAGGTGMPWALVIPAAAAAAGALVAARRQLRGARRG